MVYILLNAALFLEYTGVCHAAWFFGIIHKKVAGFQEDEVYVGTAAERAAKGKADIATDATMGTVGYVANVKKIKKDFMVLFSDESWAQRRNKIMMNITVLRDAIKL